MLDTEKVIQVLLPLPHTEPFDYLLLSDMDVRPGSFVVVPFRGREITGVVWSLHPTTLARAKLKYAITLLDIPPLAPAMLSFIRWVADYTLFSYGSVLRMVMPIPLAALPPRTETAYVLGTIGAIRLTPERERVIAALEHQLPKTVKQLLQETGVSVGVLQSLKRLGVLRQVTITLQPPPAEEPVLRLPVLAGAQAEAAVYLQQKIHENIYSVTVLDGVTGSGKTEVYFTALADILAQEEGQVLILLPEIALTAQLLSRFKERFGFSPAQWHSDISDKARKDIWHGVAEGRIRLVVGARSALFLPFSSLRIIVVDEEHEGAYKQEEGVLYHARDMAVVRAFLEKIPLLLASATPSLETVINIQAGKFTRLALPSRHGGASLPEVEVVDMRSVERPKQTWLSPSLREGLATTLKAGRQAMLFLNRRGYAPLTLCHSCGHRMTCPSCSSWMVEHRNPRRLECHHCGYHTGIPTSCPECKAEDSLVACGPGVERVAEEVKSFLPAARISIMARDTIKTMAAAEEAINAILNKEVDIIIGTQMVAKGHHFPSLTLVGVVDADLGLAGGDLRAAERTYQLLHQVSGRAGREGEKGRVILQSYMPGNPIIQALVDTARDHFMESEIMNRRDAGMPPFSSLAAVIIAGENEQQTLQAARALARLAPTAEGITVLGPAPAILYQLRKKFRYRLLLKTERSINIQKLLRHWLEGYKKPSAIQVKVDIDPYSFF